MKIISSFLLAAAVSVAVPVEAFCKNVASNACMSHLSEMIVGDTLNPDDFLCYPYGDSSVARLASVLAAHPEVSNVSITNLFGSMKPLADVPSLIALQVVSSKAGDVQAFASNTTLKKLEVYGYVSDDDLEALAGNTALRELHVRDFFNYQPASLITDKGAIALAENTTLESVSIDTPNELSDTGMLALAKNTHLTELGFGMNVLSDALCQAIAHHPTLQKVSLHSTESRKGFLAIAGNKRLRSFSDQRDRIGNRMAIALSKNTRLTELDLFNAGKLTDKGILALSKLRSLTTLRLGMDSSAISDGAMASLLKNPSLRTVTLYNTNSILGPKARAALAKNTSIETVYLANFSNGDEIAEALALNPSIRKVTLRQTPVGPRGAVAFAKGTIAAIILYENPTAIEDEGAIALAGNGFIRHLELNGNNLGSDAAKALAGNTTLTHLLLASNHIDDEGALAFAENQNLKLLNLLSNRVTDASISVLLANPWFASVMISEVYGVENQCETPVVSLVDGLCARSPGFRRTARLA